VSENQRGSRGSAPTPDERGAAGSVEPTDGLWQVDGLDRTTVFAENMTGVAACAPDPMCADHYAGGVKGGHYFSPPTSIEERRANARYCAEAKIAVGLLQLFVDVEYDFGPDDEAQAADPTSLYAMVTAARHCVARARGVE
jgi:hypothetical protein